METMNVKMTLLAADEMSKEEFGDMIAKGLTQAKADDSFDLEEVFAELIGE